MPGISRLLNFFEIKAVEYKLVRLLVVHSFFIGLSLTFIDTVAYTLFLETFDSHTLPIVYIISSTLTIVVGIIYSIIEHRLSFTQLLATNLITSILATLIFLILLIMTDSRVPMLGLVVASEILWVLASLEFWSLAGRLLTVRQGKRLFGFIGSGEMIATILGGTAVSLLVRFFAIHSLLVVSVVAMVGSLIIMLHIMRNYLDETKKSETGEEESDYAMRNLFRERYVVFIFVIAGLAVASIYFVENAFYAQAEVQFSDSTQLASFLGMFFAISGVLQLLSRAVISSWVLQRFGVIVGLLVLPLLLLIGIVFSVIGRDILGGAVWVFTFIVLTRLFDKMFRYSLNRSAFLVLYQPLLPQQRLRIQTIVEGVIEPIAGVLAGAGLLALGVLTDFDAVDLLIVMGGIVIIWIFMIVISGREYGNMLTKSLSRRNLSGATMILDHDSLRILTDKLQSPHIGEVLYAMDTLEVEAPNTLEVFLPQLIYHESPEIRHEAFVKIEANRFVSMRQQLIHRIERENSPETQATLLRALASLGEEDAILPFLLHQNMEVRSGAMVGMLKYSDGEELLEAQQRLGEFVRSENIFERQLAARVVGEVGNNNSYLILMKLLDDPSTEVQRATLLASRTIRHPRLWNAIIERLVSYTVGIEAITALSEGGEELLPLLEQAFEKQKQIRRVQSRLVRIMGRIQSEKTIEWLYQKIDYGDELVRYYVLQTLIELEFQAQAARRGFIEQFIQKEIADAVLTLATLMDIGDSESTHILYRALAQELDQTQHRILFLLQMLYNRKIIRSIEKNLEIDSRERNEYALELLELTITTDMRKGLMVLFSDESFERKYQQLSPDYPHQTIGFDKRMEFLLEEGDHPWTKMAALYVAAKSGNRRYSDEIIKALADDDPIVHETAIWALHTLTPGLYHLYVKTVAEGSEPGSINDTTETAIQSIESKIHGGEDMLLTIEKVIILKTVDMFSEVPEYLLVEVASTVEEVKMPAGEQFITKGELGDCMYIIASGEVRVHDEERTIVVLDEREMVGELAILDSAPRNASVTTTMESTLLKLHQDTFYEAISDHPQIVRGILQVLTRRLRNATATTA